MLGNNIPVMCLWLLLGVFLQTEGKVELKKPNADFDRDIDFAHSAVLDETKPVILYWDFNDTTITLQVTIASHTINP